MSDAVEVLNLFTPEEARIVTDKISDDAEDLYDLITEAYLRGAHLVLGYVNWDDYKQKEFGDLKLQLPREERQEKVHSLREQGLSTRAIASVLDVDRNTVRSDIRQVGEINPPENVSPIRGRDGKTYQPQAVASAMERELERQRAALAEKTAAPPVSKPDLGNGVSHPARFSNALLSKFAEILNDVFQLGDVQELDEHITWHLLDPFAGAGRIHELRNWFPNLQTRGIELEAEWANLHPDTTLGSALAVPFDDDYFDAVVTSPTYGNRLADHHNASDPELRRSYTHDLGRQLSEGNSGAMHWGDAYRDLHVQAWTEAVRVLRSEGVFILNIKDHIRGGVHQPVSAWHVATLVELGLRFNPELSSGVPTKHLQQGENTDPSEDRVGQELVLVFEKP